MQLNPGTFDGVYESFHNSWNLEKIQKMTLQEYANLGNEDSFCYWLEYRSKELGQIGGTALHKFEIWRPRDAKDFKDQRFTHDHTYAWASGWGKTAEEAFSKIRNTIVALVTQAQTNNWEAIENLKFNSLAKWKIAFLFSNKQLLPVYSRRAVLAIARGLGKTFTVRDRLLDIQQYIISQKPDMEDMVEFAHRVYTLYAEKKNKDNTNYYLIGSKYQNEDQNQFIDKMPDFLKHNCIAIGFLYWVDFSDMMSKSKTAVNEWVENKISADNSSLRDIKSYFRLLSQFKEGDIIAVKSAGSFNNLNIIAYAHVVKREKTIYYHDDELGHCIHVEFLETNFNLQLDLNFAKTLHQLTPENHGAKFNAIFQWYAAVDIETEEEEEEGEETTEGNTVNKQVDAPDQGYNEKEESTYIRSAIAETIVRRIHNTIQNKFMRYLEIEYPNYLLSGEKKYIDARRENEHELVLYEIKPFASAHECVRSGMGQLISYWHNSRTDKTKSIVIVGPNAPDAEAQQFINAIKNILTIPFFYLQFDAGNLKATIY